MAEKSIGVTKATHRRLAEYCGKLRTYNEGINALLDLASKTIWNEGEMNKDGDQ